MTDDTQALQRAAAGDAAALNQLVRLHQSQIRGFLLRLTGGRHALADDLAQETFLHAWRKIGQFRGDGSFAGWLLRIAWSRYLMEARRHKRERTVEADDTAIDPRSGHDDRLDLTRAMTKLAPTERAALTLCYALGYSHPEAGAILKIPLGTLKSHVLRGREKLQILMSDRENAHD
jgi:RNA polymerase sigma-70 factor (ECF subfamily)